MEALGVNAAARYLGIGRVTLYQLLKTNDGPPSLRIGKRRLFRREALDNWLKLQERREFAARAAAEAEAASQHNATMRTRDG